MRRALRRKLTRLSGWFRFGLWLAFGAGVAACGAGQRPEAETAIRAAIDIIEIICPPETTVGDCTNRVKAWLPAARADSGTE